LYLYYVENNTKDIQKEYDSLIIELKKTKSERDELKRQLKELIRIIFGSKSERFISVDSYQMDMFNELEKKIAEKEEELEKHTVIYQRDKKKKKKEKPIRTAIPAHFPRVEEIIYPENLDPSWVKIGEEVTELLEIKPLTVFVRRIVRPKYALPKDQGVVIAELPSLPIPKGNASVSLLAFILICKFIDHSFTSDFQATRIRHQ